MPSGSGFGGGGGSHFGGSSGGSSSGGGFSHRYIGPRQPGRFPIYYVYYRRHGKKYALNVNENNLYTLLNMLKKLAFIATILPLIFLFGFSGNFFKIRSDYSRYQNMIKFAEAERENGNDNYFVDATIYSVEQYGSTDRYYINYYFYSEDYEVVKGYTFSVYTYDEVKDINVGDKLEIAVDSYPLTTETDSIDLHYKNTTLADDVEYQGTKATMNGVAIFVLIAAAIWCLFGFLAHKTKIKHGEEILPNGDLPGEPVYQYVCTYCGGKLMESDANCPHCGAATLETKTSTGKSETK